MGIPVGCYWVRERVKRLVSDTNECQQQDKGPGIYSINLFFKVVGLSPSFRYCARGRTLGPSQENKTRSQFFILTFFTSSRFLPVRLTVESPNCSFLSLFTQVFLYSSSFTILFILFSTCLPATPDNPSTTAILGSTRPGAFHFI